MTIPITTINNNVCIHQSININNLFDLQNFSKHLSGYDEHYGDVEREVREK